MWTRIEFDGMKENVEAVTRAHFNTVFIINNLRATKPGIASK